MANGPALIAIAVVVIVIVLIGLPALGVANPAHVAIPPFP